MATQDEKIAAAEKALAALGATDPAEAERFVALFDSQAALLPQPEPPAPDEPEIMFVEKIPLTSENPEKQAALEDAARLYRAALAMPDEPTQG